MLKSLTPSRLWIENMILAAALPWVAGAVNATGFFVVGSYTSHVSGHLARVGDELAQGRRQTAWSALLLVLIFLAGAITATALVESARRLAKSRYVAALFVEAAVLTAFTVFSAGLSSKEGTAAVLLTGMLSFSMGLQNALVTRMSGAVVRTTHMTGVTTDIGIESVRAFYWMRDKVRAQGVASLMAILKLVPQDPELRRLRLHLLILGSFLAGAITGPMGYLAYGGSAMLLPVLVLLALMAFDAKYGLGTLRPEERHTGEYPAPSSAVTPAPPSERLAAPPAYPVFTPKDKDPKA